MNFQFKEKSKPFDTVKMMSGRMQLFDSSDMHTILRSMNVYDEFDKEHVQEIAEAMC
jgi:secreted Zn-dependent insulinase-like peptidase